MILLVYSIDNNKDICLPCPSQEEARASLPDCFKPHHVGTRFIIDCSETKVEKPGVLRQANAMYSFYKRTHTAKYLVGE